ncbi:MAG: FkbM family methyltransferase [Chitinophagaceae bacterium]
MAKNVFPESDFCLIEPQREMKDYLDGFCKEFKGSVYFLAGAGSKSGQLNLTIWDDLVGSSFLPKQDLNLEDQGKQRPVEIVTIDELIKSSKIGVPEIIKPDIQAFELEALNGATSTFGITEVFIMEVSFFRFAEAMPLFWEVINFMFQRDYVVYDFPGFARRPLDGALGQCDICFVKENSFLRSSHLWI